AGKMSRAVAHFLKQEEDTVEICIFEQSQENLKYCSGMKRIKLFHQNLDKLKSLDTISKKADVLVSCLPYYFNLKLTKMCIASKIGYVDLGGNNDIVREQFRLTEHARKAGITAIPDCGLAPGLVSLLTAYFFDYFDKTDEIHIFVGGLPVKPEPPLNYILVFSISGLINEYIEDAVILKGGKIQKVPSLTGIEKVKVKGKTYEAFYTSGGISTMPQTFKGRIKNLEYKTLRYPGHAEKIRLLWDLGFFNSENRKNSEAVLEKKLFRKNPEDLIVLKVTGKGIKNKKAVSKSVELIDYFDKKSGLTAMMRMTGFPAAAVALLIGRNEIDKTGVLFQEKDIPYKKVLNLLKDFNIQFSGLDFD
ncbi:MAG: saccharopine dehydrogenase C-terminal domain-containing protein, partial [bacterium]|nr:saccharopine dehydrogenase C-terminal domain-containing protein [bacterium]